MGWQVGTDAYFENPLRIADHPDHFRLFLIERKQVDKKIGSKIV